MAQRRPALESVAAVPPGGLADGPALLNFVVEHWRAVDLSDELDIVEHLPAGAQPGALQGVVCRSRRTGQLTVLVGAESGTGAGVVGHVLSEIGRLNATPRMAGAEPSGLIICSLPSEELRRAATAARRIELTALRLRLRPAPAMAADGGDERLRSAVEALGSWCGDAALGAARREGVPVATYLGKDSPLWRRARAVAAAVDDRFPGAAGHSVRVSRVVRALAEDLGMGGEALDYIELAGLLYDVGMMVVPDALAEKRGPLTPEEFGLVQRHVDAGARLLQQFGVLSPVSLGVRHHHERWDGRGYPGHLTGDDIPLLARMISMADGFDAMTSVRPYRPAMPQDAALEAVTEGAGKQWDPGLVSSLRRAVDRAASSGTGAVGRG
jgi:HD-GYP domain-containing protein (c-di-GMP phosphodiesterase class II)